MMSTSADNTEPLDYSYDSPGDSSKPEFSLAADQDHKRETRGRQPRGMLVAAVVVLLFVGAAGLSLVGSSCRAMSRTGCS